MSYKLCIKLRKNKKHNYSSFLIEGIKKKINTAMDSVIIEHIIIASGSPKCSARVPVNKEPIGSKPKKVSVYTPITLPLNLSGTIDCTRAFAIFIDRINAIPIRKIAASEPGTNFTNENRSIKSGNAMDPIVSSLPL